MAFSERTDDTVRLCVIRPLKLHRTPAFSMTKHLCRYLSSALPPPTQSSTNIVSFSFRFILRSCPRRKMTKERRVVCLREQKKTSQTRRVDILATYWSKKTEEKNIVER